MKRHLSKFVLLAALMAGASAHAYEVINVTGGGSITGKVTFTGKDPGPEDYPITKDPHVCGKEARKIDFVKVNNGALTEVVVYLTKIEKGKDYPADLTRKPVITQKGCEFQPYLGFMREGDELTVTNPDGILHNTHLYELMKNGRRSIFNVNQPAHTQEIHTRIELNRGSAVKVECDAHDFMHSYIFVAKNPYYAQVKDDGSYTISDVPPGEYKVKAWHPTLGEESEKVKVSGGAASTLNFQFK